MTVYQDIRFQLDNKLQTLKNTVGSGLRQVHIGWEGLRLTDQSNFVLTKLMPTDRRPSSLGYQNNKPTSQRLYGIYQILICSGQVGLGTAFNMAIADEICMAFNAGQVLNANSRTPVYIKQTEMMRSYQDQPYYKTPVNIHWYAYEM